jgi:predicted  nucleic acid-binding Zn-ribbon protein
MKDWEIQKVNALFAEIDQLKRERDQLQEQNQQMMLRLQERSGALTAVVERLDRQDQMLQQLVDTHACAKSNKTTTRASRRTKTK